jgi:F-type H+-transporting ATPase subunit b
MKRLLAAVIISCVALVGTALASDKAEAEPGRESAEARGEEGHGGGHSNFFLDHGGLVKVLIVQVIAFALLFLALKRWAFPFIAKALGDRVARIRETYDKLDAEKREVERLRKEVSNRLAGIEREAAAKVEAAVREGTAQKESILAEAESAAARLLAKAKTEIEMERAKAIEEIRQEMVRLALEAAERLVRQQLTAAKQDELFDRFVSELERVRP